MQQLNENSPVILQASSSAIKYARIEYLKKMIEAAFEEHDIPISITLRSRTRFRNMSKCVLIMDLHQL